MMCTAESVAVAAAYVVMVAFNGLANTDLFGGKDQGEISNQNPTYLTPDGLTFAVWGLIYLLEAVMVVYQFFPSEAAEALLQQKFLGLTVRWRIVIAFLLNAAWLPVFNNELFVVALVIILAYLVALLAIYKDVQVNKTSTLLDALLLTTGIAANLSWVVVASCLNTFFVLGQAGWKNEYGVAGTPLIAVIVGLVVSMIAVERVVQGKDLMYAFVAGWALQGIYRMQTIEDATRFPPEARDEQLAGAAGALSAFVWATVLIGAVMMVWYDARNPCLAACKGGRKAANVNDVTSSKAEGEVATQPASTTADV